MLREFVALVNEAVDDGFNRGLNLFMENLEEDLAKSEIIAEAGGVDTVIATILEADMVVLIVHIYLSDPFMVIRSLSTLCPSISTTSKR